jgi:hypothetical protein
VTTPTPTSVTLGTSTVTLTDSAVLSGGYHETGTITFTLFLGSTKVDTETVTVTGNGTYTTPTGYTLPSSGTVTGTYQWDATYSGDGNNSSVSESGNENEQVTVSSANPTITTQASPPNGGNIPLHLTDTATLAGGYNPGGTITFTLVFKPTATSSGTTVDTETKTVNGDGAYTTPTGYTATLGGIYTWSATYSGDHNNNSASDNGVNESVVVSGQQPTKFSLQGFVYWDKNFQHVKGTNPGIGGVHVELVRVDSQNHPIGTPIFTQTDASGHYIFPNVPGGSNFHYEVSETTEPLGYLDAYNQVGNAGGFQLSTKIGQPGYNTFTQIALTHNALNYNFGKIKPISVSGFVYLDNNRDGKFDAGDSGIGGETLVLQGTNDQGKVVQSTISGGTGFYKFSNLRPGQYSITEIPLGGLLRGAINVGTPFGGKVASNQIFALLAQEMSPSLNGINYDFGHIASKKIFLSNP